MKKREGEGTRTPNHRIDSPVLTPANPEEDADFPKVGAPGSAVETEIGISDPDLVVILQQWDSLPEKVRTRIMAIVESATDERAE